MTKSPSVSVIVPVFNAESWLQRCLDSVFNQTYQDFEIIAVNDGSEDSSGSILHKNAEADNRLIVVEQANSGQGTARNRALGLAKGEYVFFLDADDYLDPRTFEMCKLRAEEDRSDLVHFDWKTASKDPERPATYNYFNREPYWGKRILVDHECGQLIRMESYFTVTNMYRRSFLSKWGIRYDEDHIYEDVLFMVQVASRAEKISLLHAPLYTVQPNLNSTTKSDTHTDKHYRGHLHAMRVSFEALNPRFKNAKAYLARYHLDRFIIYYSTRVPLRFRHAYALGFVEILHRENISLPSGQSLGGTLDYCLNRQIFKEKRTRELEALAYAKLRFGKTFKRYRPKVRALRKRRANGEKITLGDLKSLKPAAAPSAIEFPPVTAGLIVFLGFDYRYAGNSKALFERLLNDSRFDSKTLRFVTTDPMVDQELRVQPKSGQAERLIRTAELLIAESWIPGSIKKNPASIWLQLWHGTPFKRVLFDSNEPDIIRKSPMHKIFKYQDTLRWDYLVADSKAGADKAATSFLFPEKRIIRSGYPRVKYLLESPADPLFTDLIKSRAGIPREFEHKKLVLYAPTWRDSNYGKPAKSMSFSYLPDLNYLLNELGDDYVLLFHDHNYMASKVRVPKSRFVDVSSSDIQDLLLISDYLITDYSSVVFDAMAIDLPFVLYTADYRSFLKGRGVYPEMWDQLYPHRTANVAGVIDMIKSGRDLRATAELKARYAFDQQTELETFLSTLNSETIERDW